MQQNSMKNISRFLIHRIFIFSLSTRFRRGNLMKKFIAIFNSLKFSKRRTMKHNESVMNHNEAHKALNYFFRARNPLKFGFCDKNRWRQHSERAQSVYDQWTISMQSVYSLCTVAVRTHGVHSEYDSNPVLKSQHKWYGQSERIIYTLKYIKH